MSKSTGKLVSRFVRKSSRILEVFDQKNDYSEHPTTSFSVAHLNLQLIRIVHLSHHPNTTFNCRFAVSLLNQQIESLLIATVVVPSAVVAARRVVGGICVSITCALSAGGKPRIVSRLCLLPSLSTSLGFCAPGSYVGRLDAGRIRLGHFLVRHSVVAC